jgi:hypothetical protein
LAVFIKTRNVHEGHKENEMNTKTGSVRWTSLKVFTVEVSSGSNKLYANGRQQVGLRIAIEGQDINGNSVEVSNQELRSLRLINFHGGEPILHTDADDLQTLSNGKGWAWGYLRKEQYLFFPGGAPSDGADDSWSEFTSYRYPYVRTLNDKPLQIAASITRDDGQVFLSSGRVTLTPERVPTYSRRDYGFTGVNISGRGDPYDYVSFTLNAGGINISFVDFDISPATIVKHGPPFMGTTLGASCYTGYTKPGAPGVRYARTIPGAHSQIRSEYLHPGSPVVVVSTMYRDARRNLPRTPSSARISAVDMFGNSHSIGVRFSKPDLENRELELF